MNKIKENLFWMYNYVNLKKKNFRIKKGAYLKGAIVEGNGWINKNTNFEDSYIGVGSYIGMNCNLPRTKIGRFCSLGNNISIIEGNHPTKKYVSTSPAFYSDYLKKIKLVFKKYIKYEDKKQVGGYSLIIGNDVWIGEGVRILSGIKIGDGAIIGTGALVTKNVEPYSIVGGVPAKEIKKRFSNEEIEFLKEFRWWNKDLKWLEENVELFSDIKKFMEKYKS